MLLKKIHQPVNKIRHYYFATEKKIHLVANPTENKPSAKDDRSLEESVLISLESEKPMLYPFLPYILQDLWSLGSDPEAMVYLIDKYRNPLDRLSILDLGCGKGPVSVHAAKTLNAECHGVDGRPEFIAIAQKKAVEFGVSHLCRFETGDIRTYPVPEHRYSVAILGAIGPIFGNYCQTLLTVSKHLKPEGLIIIDDAYIEGLKTKSYYPVLEKKCLLEQIHLAGFSLLEEVIADKDAEKSQNSLMFDHIKRRCNELELQHPALKYLFRDYVNAQDEAFQSIERDLICITMALKKTG